MKTTSLLVAAFALGLSAVSVAQFPKSNVHPKKIKMGATVVKPGKTKVINPIRKNKGKKN